MESQGITKLDITEEQGKIHQQPPQQTEQYDVMVDIEVMIQYSRDDHLMEQDDAMVDIEAMIQQSGDGLLDPDCCMSRVPHTLLDIKPNAYAPKYMYWSLSLR
ncbi:uncharacterized protein LOC129316408 isoform X2 [Prosopis cineraria]|uniref:uncharacterized protein LOC129316408 isoform X2 n=1 Tax=Prosopis cineraria TaxID=364024 RepID=UPI00240EFCD2|nr:uncharacterized protein LOC129316408 isoform X2 [Prosopis cineraria]